MPELDDMEEAVSRIGRRPKITDDQIRDEIVRRLSGDPADLVPFRIQRALESLYGSTLWPDNLDRKSVNQDRNGMSRS
jgi:hypothetical protein